MDSVSQDIRRYRAFFGLHEHDAAKTSDYQGFLTLREQVRAGSRPDLGSSLAKEASDIYASTPASEESNARKPRPCGENASDVPPKYHSGAQPNRSMISSDVCKGVQQRGMDLQTKEGRTKWEDHERKFGHLGYYEAAKRDFIERKLDQRLDMDALLAESTRRGLAASQKITSSSKSKGKKK